LFQYIIDYRGRLTQLVDSLGKLDSTATAQRGAVARKMTTTGAASLYAPIPKEFVDQIAQIDKIETEAYEKELLSQIQAARYHGTYGLSSTAKAEDETRFQAANNAVILQNYQPKTPFDVWNRMTDRKTGRMQFYLRALADNPNFGTAHP
jgi:hypothetical protein